MKLFKQIIIFFTLFPLMLSAQSGVDRMEITPQSESQEIVILKKYQRSINENYAQRNYKAALAYLKLYREAKDSIDNEAKSNLLSELNVIHETKKKENDIQLLLKNNLLKEKELARQKIVLYIVLLGILLILFLSGLVWRKYRLVTNLNKQLDTQNEAIVGKNNLIIDSINYAQHIQQSILPPAELFKKHFADTFIFYIPKEIVSGDIYWFREKNNKVWLATIDCTGNGVSGAMMSMVAYDLLHQTIRVNKIEYPAEILKNMNIGVRSFAATSSQSNQFQDGMDMSICYIDLETLTLKYAGAQNSIYIIRNALLTELLPDYVSVGFHSLNFNYSSNSFQLEKGDMLYLFTDGFLKQKQHETDLEFDVASLKQLLVNNSALPPNEQKKVIEDTFSKWKGQQEPTDDVLLIGVKI